METTIMAMASKINKLMSEDSLKKIKMEIMETTIMAMALKINKSRALTSRESLMIILSLAVVRAHRW